MDELNKNKSETSDSHYRLIFQNALEGIAYCKMQFDSSNNPVDFIYLEVNPAFEQLTGLKDVIGKPVTEVIPNIKELNPELFIRYGRVALGGEPEKFEIYFKPLSIWLSISAYCPEKEYFIAVFENITKRKQAEQGKDSNLKDLETFKELTVGRELKMVELKEEITRLTKELENLKKPS